MFPNEFLYIVRYQVIVISACRLSFHEYARFPACRPPLILPPVCGILGLLLHDPSNNAAPEICEGLSLLQHRGQDACGIITCGPKGRFFQRKANGMVRDVFDPQAISRLVGGMGVGHGT